MSDSPFDIDFLCVPYDDPKAHGFWLTKTISKVLIGMHRDFYEYLEANHAPEGHFVAEFKVRRVSS
jgi:hypothetical protein